MSQPVNADGGDWNDKKPSEGETGQRYNARTDRFETDRVLTIRRGNANGDGTITITEET